LFMDIGAKEAVHVEMKNDVSAARNSPIFCFYIKSYEGIFSPFRLWKTFYSF
jgi:hypothetical protein